MICSYNNFNLTTKYLTWYNFDYDSSIDDIFINCTDCLNQKECFHVSNLGKWLILNEHMAFNILTNHKFIPKESSHVNLPFLWNCVKYWMILISILQAFLNRGTSFYILVLLLKKINNNSHIFMEPSSTLNSQSNYKQKEQYWYFHNAWLQIIQCSHND